MNRPPHKTCKCLLTLNFFDMRTVKGQETGNHGLSKFLSSSQCPLLTPLLRDFTAFHLGDHLVSDSLPCGLVCLTIAPDLKYQFVGMAFLPDAEPTTIFVPHLAVLVRGGLSGGRSRSCHGRLLLPGRQLLPGG